MIIAARAVEGTPVWLGQGGLKSNHQLEWAWLMLLLTGAELASGVSQRVAPDHSSISPIVFHPHFLRARGPILLLSVQLLCLMRAIAPQAPISS